MGFNLKLFFLIPSLQFLEVLQRELDAIEKEKEAFIQDFSQVEREIE